MENEAVTDWHLTATTLPSEGVPVDVRWNDMDDPSAAVRKGGEWRDDIFDNLVPTPLFWRETKKVVE